MRRRGTALDVSGLLDAPAGKRGWLRPRGEDLVFEDGTVARFWGVNLVGAANFPTREEAERTAELLAQLGVNMTRHHHLDAAWAVPNLYGNRSGTLAIDPEALDRLDYFIAQLQKRGIYQYLDLLVLRPAAAEDGVPAAPTVPPGYKIVGEFDPYLIFLQENFVRQILGHRNPYTGKRYGRDPGIALIGIINESSLFYRGAGDAAWEIGAEHYRSVWRTMFNTWLIERYGSRDELEERWRPQPGETGRGLEANEHPLLGTVAGVEGWQHGEHHRYSRQRALDSFSFYYDRQMRYYERMRGVIREMGSEALVAGSNHWVTMPIDLHANAQLDFVDRHAYWAHPTGGWGYGPEVIFDPEPLVLSPGGGLVGDLGRRRVRDHPYVVGEWQVAAPNACRQEGAFFMAVYSTFHNWSSLQFAYSHGDTGEELSNNFDIRNQPGMLGVWPPASLIFHRRDVRPAGAGHFRPLSDAEVFQPETAIDIPAALPMVTRTGVEFTGASGRDAHLESVLEERTHVGLMISVTGEVVFDPMAGYLWVQTPRTQGVTGFIGGRTATFPNLRVSIENPYGLVIASSLEEEPISRASRILVTAIGDAVNTGLEVDPAGNRLLRAGTAPVLVEPLVGEVGLFRLEGDTAGTRVYHLDPSGRRVGEVPVRREGHAVWFELRPEHRAMHFEVVR